MSKGEYRSRNGFDYAIPAVPKSLAARLSACRSECEGHVKQAQPTLRRSPDLEWYFAMRRVVEQGDLSQISAPLSLPSLGWGEIEGNIDHRFTMNFSMFVGAPSSEGQGVTGSNAAIPTNLFFRTLQGYPEIPESLLRDHARGWGLGPAVA
jgi:hypothetical protein